MQADSKKIESNKEQGEIQFPITTSEVRRIKNYIKLYFSSELQKDDSLTGAMKRRQLEKWLIQWAQEEGAHQNNRP